MFALLRRFACASITYSKKPCLARCYASFTPRDVLRETSDEAGTLLSRFAKHIAIERYKCEEHVLPPTEIRYSDYFPITDERYFRRSVEKTPASQLPALIIHASSYRPNAAAPMYAMALNTLDAHAAAMLKQMDTTTMLETLYAFLFLMPNWLKRTDFYHAAMRRLAEEAPSSKQRFMQICFYLGLQKQQQQNDLETLLATQLGEHLASLSPLDLALISNAAYKTSTLVTGAVREAYEAALLNAILNLKFGPDNDADDALLICYIKALRLQRVQDERICQHLQGICLEPAQLLKLQPRGLAHIFAYFAEMQWDQAECMHALVERLLQFKPSELRAKDLATFLWSCAQLNCPLTTAQLRQLEVIALRKLDQGEYDYFADQLVDTCLSLCIMGHHSKVLFDAAEELKALQRQRQRAQPKVDSRLTVLRSAVAIEQPSWTDVKREQVFKELTRAPGYLLKQRDDLTAYAKQLAADADVEGVDLVCPIAGINLPSLRVQTLGEQSCIYYIELLTPQQTLRFSRTATSLLRLKRRLLESLGQRVVLLHSGDMASNAQALHQLLEQTTVAKNEADQAVHGVNN
ncbi:uncharacterized protein [Drosophila virilis]|uniref:RAP domain-containing protein n=1 Tax=Drosophila virilis TaxID=7244 RepID=B4M9G0_DROVI|nr:uncharacterized protein LOC6633961 [Drosophila virilis]EDW57836.1 uncharacterized protein Dvir_GJ17919 [Drosophila virilis]